MIFFVGIISLDREVRKSWSRVVHKK